jgi:hypothetical protein
MKRKRKGDGWVGVYIKLHPRHPHPTQRIKQRPPTLQRKRREVHHARDAAGLPLRRAVRRREPLAGVGDHHPAVGVAQQHDGLALLVDEAGQRVSQAGHVVGERLGRRLGADGRVRDALGRVAGGVEGGL